MKIIDGDDGDNLHPLGGGRFTHVYAMVTQMKPGQKLIIERKDWVTKYPPYEVIRRAAAKCNYEVSYGRMPDGSGWLVNRIK